MTDTKNTAIGRVRDPEERFFAYARERHEIYLRRVSGASRPLTDDPVLQQYRFTNVYRELDKTTAWFRAYVRDRLRDTPEVLLATVLFRMLNRIEIGEALFRDDDLLGGFSAFHSYVEWGEQRTRGRPTMLRDAILRRVGDGPYVTGAYIISTPPGNSKLDGALWIVENFRKTSDWRELSEGWIRSGGQTRLQMVFDWLRDFDYFGNFHSYEIVTDLRHTGLLENAPDVSTWASVGPGARRGLNRVHGRRREIDGRGGWGASIPEEQALEEMRALLSVSRKLWPRGRDWPRWELREVEHTLCEFDKYERTRTGEGRPRGVFR